MFDLYNIYIFVEWCISCAPAYTIYSLYTIFRKIVIQYIKYAWIWDDWVWCVHMCVVCYALRVNKCDTKSKLIKLIKQNRDFFDVWMKCWNYIENVEQYCVICGFCGKHIVLSFTLSSLDIRQMPIYCNDEDIWYELVAEARKHTQTHRHDTIDDEQSGEVVRQQMGNPTPHQCRVGNARQTHQQ